MPSPRRFRFIFRKSIRILGFVALQFVLTLTLFEVGLRVLRQHVHGINLLLYTPSVQTQYDAIKDLPSLMKGTALGFKPLQRHNDFVLNSRSMRTREYDAERRPGVYRIVAIGDSFTYASGGTPYRKMWHSQLERNLAESLTREVEVISLGVPGVGPLFEMRLWELERSILRPDLVILAFYVGNDFWEVVERTPGKLPSARSFSYAIRLSQNLFSLWQERENVDRWRQETPMPTSFEHGGFVIDEDFERNPDVANFTEGKFLEMARNRLQTCLIKQRPQFDGRMRETLSVLTRFKHEVHLVGAEFAVMIIPDEFQVDSALLSQILQRFGLREDDIDLDYPQRRLKTLLDEQGIACLDVLQEFRRRGTEQRLYWLRDTHWNVEGNALAAQLLANYVENNFNLAN